MVSVSTPLDVRPVGFFKQEHCDVIGSCRELYRSIRVLYDVTKT